ncbi:hypothetical protein B7C51_12660 [Paenibacillus larvae subsp. pulvifaciens]|uniref:SLH domain-containing protein n=1 Tax=Paenibacillus larvae subsp. pulvifaciens TaxID=1477 RepID=A0A1V0UTL0_9BACL|nr:hypothetical protein B7C51_12660 [Paenibacillus larvae subsp. pulvifaciens]
MKVDTSLTQSSFSDVSKDDPANGYALPYIEAAKENNIVSGYEDGTYRPANALTKIDRGIMANDSDGRFNSTEQVNRYMLVLSTYNVMVSVSSVKAIDANKVEVKFTNAVRTE